jgi:MFS family permease
LQFQRLSTENLGDRFGRRSLLVRAVTFAGLFIALLGFVQSAVPSSATAVIAPPIPVARGPMNGVCALAEAERRGARAAARRRERVGTLLRNRFGS